MPGKRRMSLGVFVEAAHAALAPFQLAKTSNNGAVSPG
jgi:hypothetical protein